MSTAKDGKFSWLHFGLNNASTVALIVGALWFVGKPHAETFIVDTVRIHLAAQLTERIGNVEDSQDITRREVQEIKRKQIEEAEERKRQTEKLNKILERLEQQ